MTGKTFGHYRIISAIGKGGMGEVFLAEDTRLDRKVAIKFLNAEMTGDPEKLERFEQEAKAASALNHPHILTIHEIGESDGVRYIATEYIEGATLRELIDTKDLTMLQAVGVVSQIADALSAAHEAHIIHRDVKPENIMVRRDGYAKILDFGLAKPVSRPAEGEDPTVQLVNTAPGVVMGSVRYMSPEQARGQLTDERTDIWSLGVVLYEMVTGVNPFSAGNTGDSLVAVISKEPEPIEDLVPDVPAALSKIAAKALQKEPSGRYEAMSDLGEDLKELRLELEYISKENKPIRHARSAENATIVQQIVGEREASEASTGGAPFARSSKGLLWPAAIAGILIVVIASAAGWYLLGIGGFGAAEPFSAIKTEEIASAAKIQSPVVSPDSKLVAFVRIEDLGYTRKHRLVVKQIGSGIENVIYELDALWYGEVEFEGSMLVQTFSPDGDYIFFTEADREQRKLYRISTLGGPRTKIIDGFVARASVSPDGKKIAYQLWGKGFVQTLHLANIDGSGQELILTPKDAGAENLELGNWHPDGTKLLIALKNARADDRVNVMLAFAAFSLQNPDKSAAQRIEIFHESPWNEVRDLAGQRAASKRQALRWMPEGNSVLVSGRKPESLGIQLWLISYPGGELRQITDDENDYRDASVSADGKTITAVSLIRPTSLWSLDPESRKSRQVGMSDKNLDGSALQRLSNGRLAFMKIGRDGTTFSSINEDGGDERVTLNYPKQVYDFKVTSDDRIVASVKTVDWRIHRMGMDGTDEIDLIDGDVGVELSLAVSAGGTVIVDVYQAELDKSVLMSVPLEGGKAEELEIEKADYNNSPSISPDGKHLAYQATYKEKDLMWAGVRTRYLRVVELNDGKAGRKIFEKEIPQASGFLWSPSGDEIVYVKEPEKSNFFKLNIKTGNETQISDFDQNDLVADFTWSEDGARILFFRVSQIENLLMIRDVSGGQ